MTRVDKDTKWEGGFWGGWRPEMFKGISEFKDGELPPPPVVEVREGGKVVRRELTKKEVKRVLSNKVKPSALRDLVHHIVPATPLKNARGRPRIVRAGVPGRPPKVRLSKFKVSSDF